MKLKTVTRAAGRMLNKNASKILLGFGIAGAFMAVGFAVEATPKAMILMRKTPLPRPRANTAAAITRLTTSWHRKRAGRP